MPCSELNLLKNITGYQLNECLVPKETVSFVFSESQSVMKCFFIPPNSKIEKIAMKIFA